MQIASSGATAKYSATEKLSVTEKIGYSLGDLAANLIFQTLMTFLAFFYTDVYQIPPAAAATIIFTGGLIGACFNPIMGIIADRTQTRWGKFRPWILWTAIPFGVIALAAFSTPAFSPEGKIAYAFCTYVLLVLVYSANNLTYSALSGVLTGNMAERNSLSAYRFVAVMVAQFIIQALLLPLVLILGDGDRVRGFHNTMALFAVMLTALPIIFHLSTPQSYRIALLIATVLALPSLPGLIGFAGWRRIVLLAALPLAMASAGWMARSWVPPATLWLTEVAISDHFDGAQRTPGESLQQIRPEQLRDDGLYAYTSINAPRGLNERIYHVWQHNGQEVDRIALDIHGGRKEGYRAWTHKKNFPADAVGRWQVQVLTEAGQMIGVLRFKVVE